MAKQRSNPDSVYFSDFLKNGRRKHPQTALPLLVLMNILILGGGYLALKHFGNPLSKLIETRSKAAQSQNEDASAPTQSAEDVQAETVQIPEMRGLTSDEAVVMLDSLGLPVVFRQKYDDTIALGSVISSEPPANTITGAGSSVVIWVSLGNPNIAETTELAAPAAESTALKPGDAYLALTDGQFFLSYFGSEYEPLSYGAEIAPITGNGTYRVGLTTNTAGCREYATGDSNQPVQGEGIGYAAVIVQDGYTLYPNMTIVITDIRVNGESIPLTAENYTCSDDGKELRANILNYWTDTPPLGAHSAEGMVSHFDRYQPIIVDSADFTQWETVTVEFEVSGL